MTGRGEAAWQPADYLVTARKTLQQCDGALAAKDYENACLYAERAMRPLRLLERTNWQKAVVAMRSPGGQPGDRLLLDAALALEPGRRDAVVAGRAESASGGRFRAASERFLRPAGGTSSTPRPASRPPPTSCPRPPTPATSGLRLMARSLEPDRPPTLIETPPLWITSPAVPVEAGALVRISGWVHVPTPITGSVDGLMIFDSLSGRALAERIGDTTGWEPFMLYRIAPQSGPMTVTFALAGLGEVWIDDVTIQTLGPGWRCYPTGRWGAAPEPPAKGVATSRTRVAAEPYMLIRIGRVRDLPKRQLLVAARSRPRHAAVVEGSTHGATGASPEAQGRATRGAILERSWAPPPRHNAAKRGRTRSARTRIFGNASGVSARTASGSM